MSQILFLVLIIIAVTFESLADVSFKLSYVQDKNMWLWSGLVLYTISTIIWALSLKYEFLSKAVAIYTILNLIAVILIGVFFFDESMSTISKIGLGMGIVSVILMQL
jgi:multidrug transporter EmrE-like cation transporter